MAIKFKNALTYGFGFNITALGPVDSRTVVESIVDLTSVWGPDAPAYPGLLVSVLEDGNLYVLTAEDATVAENWKLVGAGAGSMAVETLTVGEDGKVAEAENIGQVIYVTVGNEVYPAGPYIVTGIGAVAKLGTTTATGDIAGDVETLKGDVSTIKSDLDAVEADVALKANAADVYSKTEADEKFLAQADYKAIESVKVGGVALDVTDKSVDIDLAGALNPYAKTEEVNAKVGELETAIAGKVAQADFDALSEEVGAPAEGETAATGIYKVIADVETALKSDITAIPKFAIEVVESLPTENISETTVYLVKEKESAGDLYTEYIYVNGAWENLGKQTVDLSAYSTTEQMNAAIAAAVSEAIANVYSKTDVDGFLANKVDNSSFESYKSEVTAALDEKVASADFESYKSEAAQALSDGLATKADASALDAYVTKTAADEAYDAKGTAEGVSTTLTARIDATDQDVSELSAKVSANETGISEAKDAAAAAQTTANEAKSAAEANALAISGLSVKGVDTESKQYGIGLSLSDEGIVSTTVDIDTLAVAVANMHEVDSEDVLTTKAVGSLEAGVTVQSVLENLDSRIKAAVSGGVTAVGAGLGISVDASDVNNPSVSVKIAEGSAIQASASGLDLVWTELGA